MVERQVAGLEAVLGAKTLAVIHLGFAMKHITVSELGS
jgi:hypothetical protein